MSFELQIYFEFIISTIQKFANVLFIPHSVWMQYSFGDAMLFRFPVTSFHLAANLAFALFSNLLLKIAFFSIACCFFAIFFAGASISLHLSFTWFSFLNSKISEWYFCRVFWSRRTSLIGVPERFPQSSQRMFLADLVKILLGFPRRIPRRISAEDFTGWFHRKMSPEQKITMENNPGG